MSNHPPSSAEAASSNEALSQTLLHLPTAAQLFTAKLNSIESNEALEALLNETVGPLLDGPSLEALTDASNLMLDELGLPRVPEGA